MQSNFLEKKNLKMDKFANFRSQVDEDGYVTVYQEGGLCYYAMEHRSQAGIDAAKFLIDAIKAWQEKNR